MRTTPPTKGQIAWPPFAQQKHYAEMNKHTDIEELDWKDENDYIPADKFDKNGVYILSPEEKAGIQESLQQIARGELISNEDLIKEVEGWFKNN